MNSMTRLYIFLFCLFSLSASQAQTVESRISSMEMLIGQQVTIDLTVKAAEGAQVEFPQQAQFPAGIEFLGAVEHPDDCVLCQFLSLVYTPAAVIQAVIFVALTTMASVGCIQMVAGEAGHIKSTRAPPFML